MDTLKKHRKELDKIDEDILVLLGRRMNLAKKIGMAKRKNGIEIKDRKREKAVIERLIKMGSKNNIDQEVIKKMWRKLFKLSYKIEEELI